MNRSTVARGVVTSIAKWTWPVCMSKVFCLCFVCDLTKVGELTKVARQPSERVTQLLPVAWTSQRLGGSLIWACRGSYLGVQGALSGHTRGPRGCKGLYLGLQRTLSGRAGDPIWACRWPYLGGSGPHVGLDRGRTVDIQWTYSGHVAKSCQNPVFYRVKWGSCQWQVGPQNLERSVSR